MFKNGEYKNTKDIFGYEQFLDFFGDNKDLISEIELQSDEYSSWCW